MITNETKTTSPAPAGNPAAATETVQPKLADLTLKKVIEAKATYADLVGVGLAKLTNWAKETATWAGKVKETAKEFRGTAKAIGVIYAAFQSAYAKAQDDGVLDKGTSFKDYVKTVTGSPPETHAQSCGQLFSRLVVSGKLLTEDQYHTCATDWLEKANSIVSHVLANGGTVAADENGIAMDPTVKEVVNILTLKTATVDTAAKLLRELRNKQTGKAEVEAGVLDADKAIALVDDIAKAGFLGLLLSHLPDAVKTRPEAERRELFKAYLAPDGYESRLALSFADEATLSQWGDEVDAAARKAAELAAGPTLITSAAPAETPDSELPAVDIDAGELAAALTAGQIPAAA